MNRDSNALNRVAVYLHNFCGLGERVIVHTEGFPPSIDGDRVVRGDRREEAIQAALPHFPSGRSVVHLNPDTLELIETFECAGWKI